MKQEKSARHNDVLIKKKKKKKKNAMTHVLELSEKLSRRTMVYLIEDGGISYTFDILVWPLDQTD